MLTIKELKQLIELNSELSVVISDDKELTVYADIKDINAMTINSLLANTNYSVIKVVTKQKELANTNILIDRVIMTIRNLSKLS
jgi:hypothetical protein